MVAYQAPPSMGFSRQEYWSGLPFPSPAELPNPGIEPRSPSLQTDALPSEPPGKQWQRINLNVGPLWKQSSMQQYRLHAHKASPGFRYSLSIVSVCILPRTILQVMKMKITCLKSHYDQIVFAPAYINYEGIVGNPLKFYYDQSFPCLLDFAFICSIQPYSYNP